MCDKCQYKIREVLGGALGKSEESCFIQQGLSSKNQAVNQTTCFVIRSVLQSTPVASILDRLNKGLKSDVLDADKRVAYENIVNVFSSNPVIIKEEETFGGLLG